MYKILSGSRVSEWWDNRLLAAINALFNQSSLSDMFDHLRFIPEFATLNITNDLLDQEGAQLDGRTQLSLFYMRLATVYLTGGYTREIMPHMQQFCFRGPEVNVVGCLGISDFSGIYYGAVNYRSRRSGFWTVVGGFMRSSIAPFFQPCGTAPVLIRHECLDRFSPKEFFFQQLFKMTSWGCPLYDSVSTRITPFVAEFHKSMQFPGRNGYTVTILGAIFRPLNFAAASRAGTYLVAALSLSKNDSHQKVRLVFESNAYQRYKNLSINSEYETYFFNNLETELIKINIFPNGHAWVVGRNHIARLINANIFGDGRPDSLRVIETVYFEGAKPDPAVACGSFVMVGDSGARVSYENVHLSARLKPFRYAADGSQEFLELL